MANLKKVNTKVKKTNVKVEEVKVEEVKVVDLNEQKLLKKQEQNKRVWMSCEMKGHFGCMVPARYLERQGVREKFVCPICGRMMKSKDENHNDIECAANN